ncbi:lipoprotein NlpI [Maioricimonas rarisocia]|uniref:Lipoprotein NlpI n=1 Tax=Maioricimonas rarisocia TaxID=2528026 RepID=A0A517ZFQ6_9PLAN|nr:tetratricopeptide repeat protein [Maioricimonas rarisocia]QDU41318.1 lipoprotein NlpI [Maioricimonas rarisocia]
MVVLLISTTGFVSGEAPPTRTVIVITGDAEAFAGTQSLGPVAPGRVLRFSRRQDEWLMIPRLGGWVHQDKVQAIDEAEEYFDKLIEEEPTPQAWHHRGIVRLELDRSEEAVDDFTKAIEEGLKSANVHINRGIALQQQEKYREAIEDYTEAIKLDPQSALAFDNRSVALTALGQYDEALADANRALEIDSELAEALNHRGNIRTFQGKFDEAVKDYTAAIENFRGYSEAFVNRAYALEQLGQFDAAVIDYEEALRLEPDSALAANNFAWMLATCANEKARDGQRAVELAEKACELTGNRNGEYLDTLAAAHARAGDFEAAIERAKEALELLPDDMKPETQARLELYRNGQAYAEEPAG